MFVFVSVARVRVFEYLCSNKLNNFNKQKKETTKIVIVCFSVFPVLFLKPCLLVYFFELHPVSNFLPVLLSLEFVTCVSLSDFHGFSILQPGVVCILGLASSTAVTKIK